jgi:hypothetical protein
MHGISATPRCNQSYRCNTSGDCREFDTTGAQLVEWNQWVREVVAMFRRG